MALAFAPTAVDRVPVAAAAAQVPVKPMFVEAHCAKAGAPPNTVTIPAATARPRKVPPAMALAPMRRARRLSGMQIASRATAMSWTHRVLGFALSLPVFTPSPPAPRDIAVAPLAPRMNSTLPRLVK